MSFQDIITPKKHATETKIVSEYASNASTAAVSVSEEEPLLPTRKLTI